MTTSTPAEVLNISGVTIVRPGPHFANLSESLVDELSVIGTLADSVTPPKLIVDLQHVKLVGSAFLGKLVAAHKALTARGDGRFAVCNANSFCSAAMKVSKLDTLLDVHESLENAVVALNA